MNSRRIYQILLAFVVVWGAYGGNQASQAAQPLNILFIGNSHTSTNNMPGVFKSIATSSGVTTPNVSSVTFDSYYLSEHLTNTTTLSAISNGYGSTHLKWDYVILQEHSDLPSYGEKFLRERNWFQSAANGLYDKVKTSNPNAKVVMFEPAAWANWLLVENNDPGIGLSATEMQYQTRKWCNDTAYNYVPTHSTVASKNDMIVSPIGDAWEENYNNPNSINLHASDGYHPNYAGTYLGSLIMYSTIYNAMPQGISYMGNLNISTRNYLQGIATTTMTSVPEPGTLVTLIGGVSSLLLIRRRRS